jgi:D-arabinose 1-dehydrogenase-like Zn-dependent alcohol dehydrogenase
MSGRAKRPCDRLVVDRAAAVSKAPGQPLEMEEVEVAPPRAHEVRVKIICTSLCHTDVTFWRMKVRIKLVKCLVEFHLIDF